MINQIECINVVNFSYNFRFDKNQKLSNKIAANMEKIEESCKSLHKAMQGFGNFEIKLVLK